MSTRAAIISTTLSFWEPFLLCSLLQTKFATNLYSYSLTILPQCHTLIIWEVNSHNWMRWLVIYGIGVWKDKFGCLLLTYLEYVIWEQILKVGISRRAANGLFLTLFSVSELNSLVKWKWIYLHQGSMPNALHVSWHRDPHAEFIDVFSHSWKDTYWYIFPPFSLIGKCLQKLRQLA